LEEGIVGDVDKRDESLSEGARQDRIGSFKMLGKPSPNKKGAYQ
jgi:hypothetical protein